MDCLNKGILNIIFHAFLRSLIITSFGLNLNNQIKSVSNAVYLITFVHQFTCWSQPCFFSWIIMSFIMEFSPHQSFMVTKSRAFTVNPETLITSCSTFAGALWSETPGCQNQILLLISSNELFIPIQCHKA